MKKWIVLLTFFVFISSVTGYDIDYDQSVGQINYMGQIMDYSWDANTGELIFSTPSSTYITIGMTPELYEQFQNNPIPHMEHVTAAMTSGNDGIPSVPADPGNVEPRGLDLPGDNPSDPPPTQDINWDDVDLPSVPTESGVTGGDQTQDGPNPEPSAGDAVHTVEPPPNFEPSQGDDPVEEPQEGELGRESRSVEITPEGAPASSTSAWIGLSNMIATSSAYSGVSSLFVDDVAWSGWKSTVNKAFSQTVLGGTTYAVQELFCKEKVSDVPSNIGLVNQYGALSVAAHVEGERSTPIVYRIFNETTGNEETITEYLYKLSYFLANPANAIEDVEFNVFVDGDSPKRYLHNGSVPLEPGETFGRGGSTLLVQLSRNHYNRICIELTSGEIILHDFEELPDQFCNIINEVEGAAIPFVPVAGEEESVDGDGGDAGPI